MFISISVVSASENVSDVGNVAQDKLSLVSDDLSQSTSSDDVINVQNTQDSLSASISNGHSNMVSKSKNVYIKGKNLVAYYKCRPIYKFKVLDSTGKPAVGLKVKLIFHGKVYDKKTNKQGITGYKLPAKAGKYSIILKASKKSLKRNVLLFKSRTISKDVKSVYGKPVNYKVRVFDNTRKIMKGVMVTFIVGKNVYHKKTNSKGFATLKLNYDSGNYRIRYYVNKVSGTNKYIVKNHIAMKTLNWGLKGDVSYVYLIKKNMPNNYWVKKAVEATKNGIPIIAIKGGAGRTVFMTSGVHGNELPSQVAMMRMITYLTNKPIKGTVYIIPFVNVKAINQHVRLTDYDYNRIAHVYGTVSNKIIRSIVSLKCDAYGDFHSTECPGDPGENIVLAYRSPAKECVPLANYIAKNANVNVKFYSYAGEVYRWSLADYANSKGVPAVICEVISKVSTVVPHAVDLSYNMMDKFLKYNKII